MAKTKPIHKPTAIEPEVESPESAMQKKMAAFQEIGEAYSTQLDEQMGQLHNQFVAFIAAAQLPLPQVLLVLEILVNETLEQAKTRYIGV